MMVGRHRCHGTGGDVHFPISPVTTRRKIQNPKGVVGPTAEVMLVGDCARHVTPSTPAAGEDWVQIRAVTLHRRSPSEITAAEVLAA